MIEDVINWFNALVDSDIIDFWAIARSLFFATVTVLVLRFGVSQAQKRKEYDSAVNHTDDVSKIESEDWKVENIPAEYVSSSVHENNKCGICNDDMWKESGMEFAKASVIQLNCKHCFHRSCFLGAMDPNDADIENIVPCVIRGNFTPCLHCLHTPKSVSIQPLHKWQTVSFWTLLINEALDMYGPHKYGVSWAEIRKRAREISGLSLDQLREGDIQSNSDAPLADEDLDGPGQFPFFAALRDAGAKKFTFAGVDYHGRGLWTTYMVSGVEKMIFKYDWGVPPFTVCSACETPITASENAISCYKCRDLDSDPKYWCSEECLERQSVTHSERCNLICSAFEKFHIKRLPYAVPAGQ